jgi:Chaperone of endosialidase
MPSTFSPNLRFEEIQNGEQANTWGTTTNNNIGNLIEQAIAGLVQVDVTGADVTLLALDGASDQARNMFIEVIGTPGATRNVYCPNGDTKVYIVINNSDSPVNFSTVSGTGVSVPGGGHQFLYSDGTNVLNAVTSVYTFAPNQALVSSSGGDIAISPTTAQQIAWLQNVTSDVQTQLDGKLPNTTGTNSQLLANNGAFGLANVNIGSGLSYNTSTQTLSSTAGGGSVTSVAMTAPSGFNVSGSPITGAGTLALSLSTSLYNLPLYVNSGGALAGINIGSGLTFSSGTLSATSTGGLTSFQGRSAPAAVLYSSDVTNALGFTPLSTTGTAANSSALGGVAASSYLTTSSTISGSNVSGAVANATSATSATYLNNGTTYLNYSGSSVSTGGIAFDCGNLTVNGSTVYMASIPAASGTQLNWTASGQITHAVSSLRYKTNVEDAWYGLKEVLTLRPVTYMEKARQEQYNDNWTYGGLIAEEVDAAGLKEFVQYNADEEPESLSYDRMVSLLVAAIKELNAKIEALEAIVGA